MRLSAYTKQPIITMPSTPRSRCRPQRTGTIERTPALASTHTSTNGSDAAPRSKVTCSGG